MQRDGKERKAIVESKTKKCKEMEKREKQLWKQSRWSTVKRVRGLGKKKKSKFKKILQENSSELIERARRADRMEEDRLTQALGCGTPRQGGRRKGPYAYREEKERKEKRVLRFRTRATSH